MEVHPVTKAEGSGPLSVAYLGEIASDLIAWVESILARTGLTQAQLHSDIQSL